MTRKRNIDSDKRATARVMQLTVIEYAIGFVIAQVGEAYGWANAKLTNRKQAQLFCPPPDLNFNVYNYLSILDRQIAKYPLAIKSPVELYLLNGLIDTFPCKK